MAGLVDQLQRILGDRYAFEREIGSGGMAKVFLARDLRHQRSVALKILKPDVARQIGAERFLREIEIVAGLTHPNILPLHDSGDADGHLYYVMPFIEGGTLRDRLSTGGALPTEQALRIAAEVSDALHAAHAKGVIHRDVKPANVLLSHGHALLSDFGIAGTTAGAGDLTRAGGPVGTPQYMSPEQAAGDGELGAGSDLYSLGCVLFEMLAGRPPFEGRSTQTLLVAHLTRQPPSLSDLGVSVPLAVEKAIASALEKDPEKRVRSAGLFGRMLRPRADAATPARAEEKRPNLGPLVSRCCDRWRQINAFDSLLRRGWSESPGTPQVYVLYGGEGGAHSSFIDRLAQTSLRQFADQISPLGQGVLSRFHVPWPLGDDLEVLKRDLAVSLFRELNPSYMGEDLSAFRLFSSPSVSRLPLVLLEHDIRVRQWSATLTRLLRWYFEEFIGSMETVNRSRQTLVFLKVIFPAGEAKTPIGRWRSQRMRGRFREEADAALADAHPACIGMALEELRPVSLEDVKDWFVKNRIYESEERQRFLAESILGGAPLKPLAVVESALEEIHRVFVAEHSRRRGELA